MENSQFQEHCRWIHTYESNAWIWIGPFPECLAAVNLLLLLKTSQFVCKFIFSIFELVHHVRHATIYGYGICLLSLCSCRWFPKTCHRSLRFGLTLMHSTVRNTIAHIAPNANTNRRTWERVCVCVCSMLIAIQSICLLRSFVRSKSCAMSNVQCAFSAFDEVSLISYISLGISIWPSVLSSE